LFGEYRAIDPQAKLLIYLSFAPSLAYGLIYTDLAYFLTTIQGVPAAFSGLVFTIMALTTVLTSLPMGALADRYGRLRFLILGNVLASLTMVLFVVSTDRMLLIAAAVAEGATEAAFASSSSALLAEKAGNVGRTAAFSYMSFLSNAAYGLGGFALPLVLILQSVGLGAASSHAVLYVAVAAASLLVTPFFLRIKESPRPSSGEKRSLLPRRSKGVLVRYAVTSVLVAFGAGFFVPLMTLWFRLAYNVSDVVSGPLLGISGLLIAGATLTAPYLGRRLGLVRAAVLTQGLSTIFMLAVPFSPNFVTAGVIYTVRSFMMNAASPLVSSMIMGLVHEDERGAAAGLNAALWKLPNGISTYVGASMMGAGLLALPFYLATVLYVASVSMFWVFFHDAKLPEESVV
jgi:MFS family permease